MMAMNDFQSERAATSVYRARVERFEIESAAYRRRSQHISYGRLACFLGAVAAVATGASTHPHAAWLYAVGAGLLAAFFVLVGYHSRTDRALARVEALTALNRDALARLDRRWDALLPTAVPAIAEQRRSHPYADDLDVFGHASLFQLLAGPATSAGHATLARWLLEPAGIDEIAERQQAVTELAPLIDLRQELSATARLDALGGRRVDAFLAWAEGRGWFARHTWLVWVVRLVAAAIIVLIALQYGGAVEGEWWLLPFAAGLILTAILGKRVHRTFDRASAGVAFRHYATLFALVSGTRFSSRLLLQLQQDLTAGGIPAATQMGRLQTLMDLADLRVNALMHAPVHVLTLWDFHVLERLERWQQQAGPRARGWLAALGRFEALALLAGLAYDNPDWIFPEMAAADGEPPLLQAAALGHVLLPASTRVANDVRVGPPGTFLLVTGSNMSGKSTLLRAIGLNVVLAQAGGPVCAQRLRLPPVNLQTCIRVQDSLEDGVSYFMAALKRLKQIVDASRDAGEGGRPILLYLLDEILQGTNPAERQTAVRTIVRHLLERDAIGAITTHDLSLADDPHLAPTARPVHFTEHLEQGPEGVAMTFDYTLRPGVATSRNALMLMHMIGLD